MVRFTPESQVSPTNHAKFNYLAYYTAAGGHIWTEGKSDSQGGLGAVLSITNQSFPPKPPVRDHGDEHGLRRRHERRQQHRVQGRTASPCSTRCGPAQRIDRRMPIRRIDYDAMAYGFKRYRASRSRAGTRRSRRRSISGAR